MTKKLKITEFRDSYERDYSIELPERFEDRMESVIRIVCKKGEFVYKPRSLTFLRNCILTAEELEAIVRELKRLNKERK